MVRDNRYILCGFLINIFSIKFSFNTFVADYELIRSINVLNFSVPSAPHRREIIKKLSIFRKSIKFPTRWYTTDRKSKFTHLRNRLF